jgi:hypothetical protein
MLDLLGVSTAAKDAYSSNTIVSEQADSGADKRTGKVWLPGEEATQRIKEWLWCSEEEVRAC